MFKMKMGKENVKLLPQTIWGHTLGKRVQGVDVYMRIALLCIMQ